MTLGLRIYSITLSVDSTSVKAFPFQNRNKKLGVLHLDPHPASVGRERLAASGHM